MKSYIQSLFRRFDIYLHRGPFIAMHIRQMDNLLYFSRMYEKIKDVDGSVVECGVGRGRSFLYLNYLAYREGKQRDVWGFDSFEGFPEPTAHDTSFRNPKKGEWRGFNPTLMKRILLGAGFSAQWVQERVHLVRGFFNATLGEYTGGSIALLHIDSDLYESYKDPLEILFPKVAEGGLILFDEYNRPKWPGAKKAVDEFLATTSYSLQYDELVDRYFLIK